MSSEPTNPTTPEVPPDAVGLPSPFVILYDTGTNSSSADTLPDGAAPDLDLLCAHCHYNLRGVPQDRCPECGRAFDRQRLMQWTTGRELPLLADPGGEGVLPTESIFAASLMWPGRLARNLPPSPSRKASLWYGRKVRGITTLATTTILVMLNPRIATLIGMVSFGLGVIVGSGCAELIMAALLGRLVQPIGVPPADRHAFWRAFCRCFAGHLVGLIGGIGLALIIMMGMLLTRSVIAALVPLIVVASPILYWWVCLGLGVLARGEPSPGRTAALLALPIVTAVAIGIGVATALICSLILVMPFGG